MNSPLKDFIEKLKDKKREEKPNITNARHTHTSGGSSNENADIKCDGVVTLQPGRWKVGDLVRVRHAAGTIYAVVQGETVATGDPFRLGRWYWLLSETGDEWVHEDLVDDATCA
jgi:hypothetical protein